MNSRLLILFFYFIFPFCFLWKDGKRSGNVMHTHCNCAKKRGVTSELNEASFSAAADDFVAADDFTEKEK